MADSAPILYDPADTIAFCREHELERAGLIEVLYWADSQRALCTSNDVRGFDLITMNAKAARALREVFCGDRWLKDETDNQPGIYNPHLKIRVIPCNFDKNAGNRLADPTNLVQKGEASREKVRCNKTGWLPGLPEPVPADDGITTLVLGSYFHDGEPLRAELSHPVGFIGKRYTRFLPRVILLSGLEDDPEPVGRLIRPDRDGPVEVVDIAITRR